MLSAGFFASDGIGPQVIVALAVLGGLWALIRGIPKATGGISRADQAFRAILGDDKTPGMSDRLASVEKELKPNGGSSLRDDLTTVKRGVAEANRVGQEAKEAAEGVAARLEASNQTAAAERSTAMSEIRAAHVKVDALMRALDQYAQERWAKDEYARIREAAYIRALKSFGLDLTAVAEALGSEGDDDDGPTQP